MISLLFRLDNIWADTCRALSVNQSICRSDTSRSHPTLHADDHRPRRPGLRPDLRQRHDRLRSGAVGPALDHLRHLARGHHAGQAAADDGRLRLLRTGPPEEGVGSGFRYKTVPHVTLEVHRQQRAAGHRNALRPALRRSPEDAGQRPVHGRSRARPGGQVGR